MAELSNLRRPRGAVKEPQRVGRGVGARKSKTAGKGNKGQLSRSGVRKRPGFEGGQMPLHRRLPKRGFANIFRREYAIVNVESLNCFAAGARVTPEALREQGLVRQPLPVKILGEGAVSVKLAVAAHAFSASAKEKIEKAGGSVEVLPLTPARSEAAQA
ncbi:MAG TPA: 50S ribosomal protein L15 [Candidatus Xenobia bacterium]|nr:50S ribosomal protein L15 [Candidatus Xenobia bacterium]